MAFSWELVVRIKVTHAVTLVASQLPRFAHLHLQSAPEVTLPPPCVHHKKPTSVVYNHPAGENQTLHGIFQGVLSEAVGM